MGILLKEILMDFTRFSVFAPKLSIDFPFRDLLSSGYLFILGGVCCFTTSTLNGRDASTEAATMQRPWCPACDELSWVPTLTGEQIHLVTSCVWSFRSCLLGDTRYSSYWALKFEFKFHFLNKDTTRWVTEGNLREFRDNLFEGHKYANPGDLETRV